jgi:hypothetical protein
MFQHYAKLRVKFIASLNSKLDQILVLSQSMNLTKIYRPQDNVKRGWKHQNSTKTLASITSAPGVITWRLRLTSSIKCRTHKNERQSPGRRGDNGAYNP